MTGKLEIWLLKDASALANAKAS